VGWLGVVPGCFVRCEVNPVVRILVLSGLRGSFLFGGVEFLFGGFLGICGRVGCGGCWVVEMFSRWWQAVGWLGVDGLVVVLGWGFLV